MLVKPGIILFFFATFAAFCSIHSSIDTPQPFRGLSEVEQKAAKVAKGEGVTEFQCVIEVASGG